MKIRAREIVVTVSLLIVIALSLGLLATTAGGQSVRYEGILDTWYFEPTDPPTTYYGAKIVRSYWRVYIDDDKATFLMKFIELNIDEPPQITGTYDYFTVRMRTDDVKPTDDGWVITGISHWWKNGAYYDQSPMDTQIIISETTYEAQISINVPMNVFTGSLKPPSFTPS